MNTQPALSGVIGRIARLPDQKFEDIKALWKQLFASPMPTHNRQYLERRIAYRLQELEYAQQNPGLLERNKARVGDEWIAIASCMRVILVESVGVAVASPFENVRYLRISVQVG